MLLFSALVTPFDGSMFPSCVVFSCQDHFLQSFLQCSSAKIEFYQLCLMVFLNKYNKALWSQALSMRVYIWPTGCQPATSTWNLSPYKNWRGAGDLAQLAEDLPGIHKFPTCTPNNIWEARARWSEAQGHPVLHDRNRLAQHCGPNCETLTDCRSPH